MKVDKRNAKHWAYLFLFAVNVLIGVIARWLAGSRENHLVLYGHKLNGNLKALYEYLTHTKADEYKVNYLVLNPAYGTQLRNAAINVLSALYLPDVVSACRANCIVTDHGPHALYFLNRLTDTKFIDVWHGIPFKGFDQKDFHWLHGYKATFVASPSMKRMYEDRYGFASDQVIVTGYARTDKLFKQEYEKEPILKSLGISGEHANIILFAPTWHHGDAEHSNIPFGMVADRFFSDLDNVASQFNWLIAFRRHLNSEDTQAQRYRNIRFIPLSDYPDTEALLSVSDVLVSDWSSIVFDFLVLRRPTIFIDTKAPFAKGFSYEPEYRFGPIVGSFEGLIRALHNGCQYPDSLLAEYAEAMQRVSDEIYDHYVDGRSAERYVREIDRILTAG